MVILLGLISLHDFFKSVLLLFGMTDFENIQELFETEKCLEKVWSEVDEVAKKS